MRLVCATAILLTFDCVAQNPRDPMNLGVQAFKSAQYTEAADDFRKAVDADPTSIQAHLYLGTALEMQYIPGLEDAANLKFAQDALSEFQQVLDLQPDNQLALSSIASLYYNEKKFDQAAEWNHKVIAADPNKQRGLLHARCSCMEYVASGGSPGAHRLAAERRGARSDRQCPDPR